MFKLSSAPLEQTNLREGFSASSAGAFASFEGWVRNHQDGKSIVALEYEAHPPLCELEAKRIFDEARSQFPVIDVRCFHRVGKLQIGEMAVWVGVLAEHRDAAFKACRYIIDELKTRLPIWKKEYYLEGNSEWIGIDSRQSPAASNWSPATGDPLKSQNDSGDLIPGRQSLPRDRRLLPLDESIYYSRQINLPELGQDGQQKLKEAKVLVVGVGGLGCAALTSLAGAGVGTIGICEFDLLEESNLHRQFLYAHQDIGQPKASLAARRLQELNPYIHIVIHPQKLDAMNAAEIMKPYTIVLDCTDNFPAKFLLNDACFLFKKILVQASIYQNEGQCRIYRPGPAGCLRCLWPSIPEEECIGNCAQAGVLGVVPSVFGHLQAWEALKMIIQMEGQLHQETILGNLQAYRWETIEQIADPDCPLCGPSPSIIVLEKENYNPSSPLTVSFADIAKGRLKKYVLIDVREASERKNDPILGIETRSLPVSRFSIDDIPYFHNETYVLICAKGIRSYALTQQLYDEGLTNFRSLKGGWEEIKRTLNTKSEIQNSK
ncbi:MAG: ThiF family adenylyltransferase [Candidatus Omnitrophota bacterium]|nr:ThiF family adenylyltransferase [Candidatus Omnitrophota bacterium]